jgi:hypothetical protein
MACYAYSVLTRWLSSVYSGAGREPSLDQMAKQVAIASSVTPKDVNNTLLLQETSYDIPNSVQPTDRKEGDNSKVIIIPLEAAKFNTGKAHCAFVTTRSEEEMEDCLICDGGTTCILTKSLEKCSLCKPKVVVIQTAHESTVINATHLSYKTYYVCDRLGEVRLIIVKAYMVSGLKHDLLSVRTQQSRICSKSSS